MMGMRSGKVRQALIMIAATAIGFGIWSCNKPEPDQIKVLQIHLEDSLSVQAGLYDSIRIDLADKDGMIWRARVFGGPYDKQRDKARLENLEIPEPAPVPLKIVISIYKGDQKQGEFLFQISTDNIAQIQPSTFVPKGSKSDSSASSKDTALVTKAPGRPLFASHDIEIFEGGDSAKIGLIVQPIDSGRDIVFKSGNEGVFVASGGRYLYPKTAGQGSLIAFFQGFPESGDTAIVRVTKDVPILNPGLDRKIQLDSAIEFPLHVTQRHGTVRVLKWDLDGDGIFDDSASKADTVLSHTYKTKGEFTLKFYAMDSEGNEASKSIKVQAGLLTPFVVITKPSSDTLVNNASFTVEFLVDGIRKTKDVFLKEGQYMEIVLETNSYGTGSDTVNITLDTQAPGKPVFSPSTPEYIASNRPSWTWSQNPSEKGTGIYKLRLDGRDSIISSTTTFKPDVDLVEGIHELVVQERDEAGNWSQFSSHAIHIDLTKPVVRIESPSSQADFVTAGGSTTISGSAIDFGGVANVKCVVSGRTNIPEGTEKWKTGLIPLVPDSAVFAIVSAIDMAGNIGLDTIRIQQDTRGPIIAITSPSALGSLFTTGSKQLVKGTASDNSSIKRVTFQLTGVTNSEGDAEGTTYWTLPELTLKPGISKLSVTAYDSLMNSTNTQFEFNYKPNIILVNVAATGANTGTTWNDAYSDLQVALSKTSSAEVWVARGTYKPTTGQERTVSFQMREGMNIFGGFRGGETSREERSISENISILSGEVGASVASDNVYHVVLGENNASLDGFTIVGGHADGADGEESSRGGAVFANGTSPNIINCIIKNNYALDGAGLYLSSGFPQIVNCIFVDNRVRDNGGAIRITLNATPLIANSLFARNQAFIGGSIFSESEFLKIKNVLFHENDAPYGKNVTTTESVQIYNSNADTTWEGGLVGFNGTGKFYFFGKKGYWKPQFQGENDFRIKPGSPGIDEGVNDQDIPNFDIAGGSRPKGKQMDIGPYEQ
jgi:hypothetical protein